MEPIEWIALVSAILTAAAGTAQTVNSYQNAKVQQKQAEQNAQQAEYEAQMERSAEAMNAARTRREARVRIAAAQAKYASYGYIGESADATIEDAYVNLAGDLSALHFNYENKAIQAENEALMYRYNSKVAGMNKTSAVIGGTLNTTASTTNSVLSGYKAGAFGGDSKTNSGGTNA